MANDHRKVTAYTIVDSRSAKEVEKEVLSHQADGWRLYGSPFYIEGIGIHQAMVKVDLSAFASDEDRKKFLSHFYK